MSDGEHRPKTVREAEEAWLNAEELFRAEMSRYSSAGWSRLPSLPENTLPPEALNEIRARGKAADDAQETYDRMVRREGRRGAAPG